MPPHPVGENLLNGANTFGFSDSGIPAPTDPHKSLSVILLETGIWN